MMAADIARHTATGRSLAAAIDTDRTRVADLAAFPLAERLNRLGLPGGADGADIQMSLVERCDLYEAIGAIDPNLIFAAPGPGMAGLVVGELGSDAQKRQFFDRFRKGINWSFFALTEPDVGTDAGAIGLAARQVDGGYRLTGEKYLVGQGWRAPIGVVFARSAPGPLGSLALLIEPAKLEGFSASALSMFGCRGANTSHMVFDDVFVPDDAVLGAHLRPTERIRRSASATFDALRPCVGAVALGVARSVLDRAEAAHIAPKQVIEPHRAQLAALLNYARNLSARTDAGHRPTREAGLSKVLSVKAAISAVDDIAAVAPPPVLFGENWLRKAWRDVRAFEYAEGISALHRTQAADLFRSL